MTTKNVTKQCTKCHSVLPLGGFYKQKGGKFGVGSKCKKCYKKYFKKYFKSPRGKKAIKKYHQSPKGKKSRKKSAKKYYLKNPEYVKQYYKENKEKRSEYQKQWQQTPKGKAAIKRGERKRRALELSAYREDVTFWLAHIWTGRCMNPLCNCPISETNPAFAKATVDHIIPLIRGGNEHHSNVQWLCFSCNAQKHTMTMDEWMQHLSTLQNPS